MTQSLLTAEQTTERLNVSRSTLYRLHDEGLLRAVEIVLRKRKRLLRWRVDIIEKFIADRSK